MVYTFFGKRLSDDSVKNENRTKQELAKELHTLIRNFADLADMQLLSKLIKVFCFFAVLLIFIVNMRELFL